MNRNNLGTVVLDLLESTAKNMKAQPLNLGGIAGIGGGAGAPPGGFIGWLPQTRSAYDEDEIASSGTPASGMSLLDNLNHIRYRLNTVESGILVVDEFDGNPTIPNVNRITFSGSVAVTQLSPGHALVNITASGGGGSPLVVEDISGTPTVANVDKIIFSGATLTNLGSGDVLVDVSGGTIVYSGIPLFYDNLTSQVPGTHYDLTNPVIGTMMLFYNTTLQSDDTFVMDGDNLGFTTSFTTYSGDSMVAIYGVTSGYGSSLTVEEYGGTPSIANVTKVVFSGVAVDVTDLGGGEVVIEITATAGGGGDGWTAYSAVIPTRTSADDPTYTMQFAGVDLTGTLCHGMPIKWTQNSIVRYGWISSAPAYAASNTTFTVLTRTDSASANYDVLDTATYAISNFYYGLPKQPGFGMPISPINWDVRVTDTNYLVKNSPTINVLYGGANAWTSGTNIILTVPIGLWDVGFDLCLDAYKTGTTQAAGQIVLSTSNNSVSDTDLVGGVTVAGATGNIDAVSACTKSKIVELVAKTIYYAMAKSVSVTDTSIGIAGQFSTSILTAKCMYIR